MIRLLQKQQMMKEKLCLLDHEFDPGRKSNVINVEVYQKNRQYNKNNTQRRKL